MTFRKGEAHTTRRAEILWLTQSARVCAPATGLSGRLRDQQAACRWLLCLKLFLLCRRRDDRERQLELLVIR